MRKRWLQIRFISLGKGASNKTFASGMTPLTCAAQRDSPRIVEFLLDHGVDIDVKSRSGRTSLIIAACEPSPNVLRLLLERGANIYLRDNENKTVFGILCDCDESTVEERKAILEEHYYRGNLCTVQSPTLQDVTEYKYSNATSTTTRFRPRYVQNFFRHNA